jgi:hypothetical protein
MPVIRCTAKLLAEIDDPTDSTPSTPSQFGDWYGQAAVEVALAEPEKAVKVSATATLEHVKAVALTIKVLGGFVRLYELLGLNQGNRRIEKVQGFAGSELGDRNGRNSVLIYPPF